MTDFKTYLEAGQFSLSNLLFDHYATLGLTQTEFMTYLFIDQWQASHHQAPDLKVLAARMNVAPNAIYSAIETLIQKQAIALESVPDGHGRMRDHYDLSPILAKLPTSAGGTPTRQLRKQMLMRKPMYSTKLRLNSDDHYRQLSKRRFVIGLQPIIIYRKSFY